MSLLVSRPEDGPSRIGPDWVICGLEMGPQGFMVIASDKLFLAEFETKRDLLQEIFPGEVFPRIAIGSTTHTLTTHMNEVVFAYGSTYADAMANLFKHWSPDRVKTPQLSSTSVELMP